MEQNLTNVVLGVLTLFNVWLVIAFQMHRGEMRDIKASREDELRELRGTDSRLGEQMSAIRELVAGQYIKRDEFNTAMAAQSTRILDAIGRVSTQITERA